MAKNKTLQGRVTQHEKNQIDKLISLGIVFHESDAVRKGIELLLVKYEKKLVNA